MNRIDVGGSTNGTQQGFTTYGTTGQVRASIEGINANTYVKMMSHTATVNIAVFFGITAVTGASILSWEDTQIKVSVPSIAAGRYAVKVRNASAVDSNAYANYQLLSGAQVTVRFIVTNATVNSTGSANLGSITGGPTANPLTLRHFSGDEVRLGVRYLLD